MYIVNLNQDQSRENKYLSTTLIKKIQSALENKKKTILYLNKRGSYESLICWNCSKIFQCKNCDTSLSLHGPSMVCHICWHTESVPKKCDSCWSTDLHKVGVGTKQIESSLKTLFPQANIFRMDTDVVKNKSEKNTAIKNLEYADIVIGTKMITTGFDFENIGLIGVILLEQELQFPSYKAEELLYANIKQFLGRGGRKWEQTDFLLQTFTPEHPFVTSISQENTKDFFLKTLKERQTFHYPPFSEFITLEYRHKDKEKSQQFIEKVHKKLTLLNTENEVEIFKNPNAFKKYNQYYYKIILKGANLRAFLLPLKKDIFRERNLTVIFE